MGGVGDEVTAHRLQAHLARHIADEQQQLAVTVGRDLQRQIRVLAAHRTDNDRRGVVGACEVTHERRLAQQILNAHAEVPGAAQVQQACPHTVEPHDFALRVENDDAVGQGRRGALQLAHQLHEALFVKALAAVQADNLRDDLTPDSADVGRVGVVTVAQPPFQAKQVRQHPRQVQRERARESLPGAPHQPANTGADEYRPEQPTRREPPYLCRGLHVTDSLRLSHTVRPEKRYPEPRTVCTKRSYPNSSSALRTRRMCTSMVRSSTYTLPPQMRSRS